MSTSAQSLSGTISTADNSGFRFFELAPDLFYMADFDGLVRRVNPALLSALGYGQEDLLSRNYLDFIHPGDQVRTRSEFDLRLRGGPGGPFINRWRARNGVYHFMEWTARIDRELRLVFACARKVTGGVAGGSSPEATASVAAMDAELAPFFDLSLDMLCIAGLDGFFKRVNSAFERGLGYSSGELVSHPFLEFLHPDDLQRTQEVYAAQLRGENVLRFENRYRHKNGGYRWLAWTGAPSAKDGRIYAVARDITEQKEAQEELRNSRDVLEVQVRKRTQELERTLETLRAERERYLSLLRGTVLGIVVHRDDKPLFANPAFAAMFGYDSPEEVISTGELSRLFRPAERERLREYRQALLRGEPHPKMFEIEGACTDGKSIWLNMICTAIQWEGQPAFQTTFIDVSDKKILEEQLSHSQRLESVGQLAGGVAHDFNNVLSVILSYSGMLKERFTDDPEAFEDIVQIEEAAQRAAALTRQLLAFSRRQILKTEIVDINGVLTNVEKMLARLIGEDVELRVKPAPGVGLVRADVSQLEQVLMNLAVNARDAMPNGGMLTVESANVTLDAHYINRNLGVEAGEYVMLAVSDTGSGMSPEIRARIFEPFFTTKEKGKGTGLGLATVYGIVKQSGGEIHVYSEEGVGTTFRIYFPRLANDGAQARPVELAPVDLRGSETILLVEDEDQVRRVAQTILRDAGYVVLEARHGAMAAELASMFIGTIHLLLTDVVMPEMNGRELAERLAPLRPNMRVLFMSGYTEDVVLKRGVLTGEVNLMEKPFSKESLLSKIREALDRKD
jgi:PAS domain S-box-containing protein